MDFVRNLRRFVPFKCTYLQWKCCEYPVNRSVGARDGVVLLTLSCPRRVIAGTGRREGGLFFVRFPLQALRDSDEDVI
jgi:hypothetical protein